MTTQDNLDVLSRLHHTSTLLHPGFCQWQMLPDIMTSTDREGGKSKSKLGALEGRQVLAWQGFNSVRDVSPC
jgi:hypothetical protein